MNELATVDFGVTERKGKAVTSSRNIGHVFGRRHDHVLRTIENLTDPTSGVSEKFIRENFFLNEYIDPTGRTLPEYLLTRKGFVMTMTEFKTAKARQLKEAYIDEFDLKEQFIIEQGLAEQYKHWKAARAESKQARLSETDAIRHYLIPLVEAQNPTSSYLAKPARIYQNYSKLVNNILGIKSGERDRLPRSYLRAMENMENAIKHIIEQEAPKNTPYKEIYQKCKVICHRIKDVSFLPMKRA